MVQFYPWFKFYFPLFLGIVMKDNEFETKEIQICTKDIIEPQLENTTSIRRVRNVGKLVMLFHPSPKNTTKSRSALKILKWRRAR